MKKAVLLLVAILAWPIGAQAITGNELLAECRSREPHSRGYCLGLIVGVEAGFSPVRDIKSITRSANSHVNILFSTFGNCLSSGVTHGQMRDIVVRFLEQNPGRRHEQYHVLVFDALKEAFPCQPERR